MAFSHQGQAIQLSVTPYEAAKVKERKEVVGGTRELTQLTLEVQVDGKVQVTIVFGIGPHSNGAKDLLASLHC